MFPKKTEYIWTKSSAMLRLTRSAHINKHQDHSQIMKWPKSQRKLTSTPTKDISRERWSGIKRLLRSPGLTVGNTSVWAHAPSTLALFVTANSGIFPHICRQKQWRPDLNLMFFLAFKLAHSWNLTCSVAFCTIMLLGANPVNLHLWHCWLLLDGDKCVLCWTPGNQKTRVHQAVNKAVCLHLKVP